MMRKMRPRALGKAYADLVFDKPLAEIDGLASELADLEQARQNNKLIMIASEALCPKPIREALSSTFTNLYAEGYPRTKMTTDERCALHDIDRQMVLHRRYQDRRYYKGCDYVNMVEALAQRRVAELYATQKVPADHIYANVQPHSGASANNAVYEAFLKPGDVVFGLSLSSGGHLTHGSPVNRSGKHYNIFSYTVDLETGKIDYDKIREMALKQKPKMMIGGYSAYTWDMDWKRLREIADEVGNCIVLADVSHIAGLIAGGMLSNPIEHAHVVVFTTQKTLCGPRGAVILTTDFEIAKKIDSAVFPGEQSGAHFNNILAKAVCFEIAKTDTFKAMMRQIVKNAQALAKELERLGVDIAYGGTENHIVLANLRGLARGGYQLTGETASRILDLCGITCNKNQIAGDENAVYPSAVRFGTTWVTQRGLKEEHMARLAKTVHMILTNIVPFDYIGGGKDIARGKIRFDFIEKARKDVCRLVHEMDGEGEKVELDYPHACTPPSVLDRQTPLFEEFKELGAKFGKKGGWTIPREVLGHRKELAAAKKNALIFDASDIPAIEIAGERSTDFLQEILTRNVYTLDEHDGMETLMLAPNGEVMDSVCVFRLRGDACGPRYLLTSETGIPDEVKDWLTAMSDGYTRFDMDVFMKVEGPVIIQDRWRSDVKWAAVDVAGKNARRVIERVAGRLPERKHPWMKDISLAGGRLEILKLNQSGGPDRYRIYGTDRVVRRTLEKMLSENGGKGPVPGGYLSREGLSARAGLPDGGRKFMGYQVLRRRRDLFDLRKPYFIGAELLRTKEEIRLVLPPEIKPSPTLKKSFLLDAHRGLFPNVSIHPFAGWEMPVVFDSIRSEHLAVREAAGLFDLSHMGVFEITGPYAPRFLDLVTTNYVRALRPGQSHYSYILDPTGKVLDDVFVYCLGEEHFLIVANAVNADKIERWLHAVNEGKASLTWGGRRVTLEGKADIRNLKDPRVQKDRRMIIALQGPKSREMLSQAVDKNGTKLYRMKKFEIGRFAIKGAPCFISRTGYTGEEFGYEVFVHPDRAEHVWKLLLGFGAKPAGLGARDSTRTEAGLPLWGNELAGPDSISPIETGYGAFVKLHKPFFIGRDEMVRAVLNREREVIRFKIDKKGARIVRRGGFVCTSDGEIIGEVTSSVVVGTNQIGLALVARRRVQEGASLLLAISQNLNDADRKAMKEKGRLDPSVQSEPSVVLPRFPPRTNGHIAWH